MRRLHSIRVKWPPKTFCGMRSTEKLSMRIGVLTYYRNGSYGAALQAYALQTYLKKAGYESELIRYIHQWPPPLTLWQFVRSRSLQSIYGKCMSLYQRWITGRFASQYLIETDCIFTSKRQLEKAPPDFDAYICGSDQIWNPWSFEADGFFDETYFLDFVKSSYALKISYAASFGRAELPLGYSEKIEPLIKDFSSIGVREESALGIIESFGKHAEKVLDPTLLLDRLDYLALHAGGVQSESGLVSFILGSDKSFYLPACEKLAALMHKPIDFICPQLYLPKNVKSRYPSVAQWVELIRNADFVLTDSFHGTVFSIIHERPFLVLMRSGGVSGRNDRLLSLLSSLGLQNRVVFELDFDAIESIYKKDVDWTAVRSRLESERKKSMFFLEQALNKGLR